MSDIPSHAPADPLPPEGPLDPRPAPDRLPFAATHEPHTLHQAVLVPLDAIRDDLLPRDRGALDEDAMDELRLSLMKDGLRMPVELAETEGGDGAITHALISGFRRLTCFRRLAADFPDNPRWWAIPAVVRPPERLFDYLRLIAEENAIRSDVSPWDQARYAVESVPRFFETTDAAVNTLYAAADRSRRARIRSICMVVEALGGHLLTPQHYSLRQLERISAALRGGFVDLIVFGIENSRPRNMHDEWRLIENVLIEAEREARSPEPADPRPGYPRRVVRIREDLRVRREMTKEGWNLVFTGREAQGKLMQEIMDEVERMWGR